jgi:aspyridone synthetase trans-acting enoyl reductase
MVATNRVLFSSGLIPVTACSPGRFEWVRSLGAAAAFDYHSPSVGSEIRAYTDNTLTMAIDCLTTRASMSIYYEAIGSCGGKYVALDPFPVRTHTRRGVRPSWVLGLTVFGAPIAWKRPFNAVANPKDRAFAEAWFVVAQQMLAEGRIQGHAYETRRGGLEALVDGIDEVRKGRVAGRKLVYRVDG